MLVLPCGQKGLNHWKAVNWREVSRVDRLGLSGLFGFGAYQGEELEVVDE